MSAKKKYKKDTMVKGWVLQDKLGAGGSAEVWIAKKGNKVGAIKLLQYLRENPYLRFKREISSLLDNQNIDGVMKITEYDLDTDFKKNLPYFIMPVGTKFNKWREGKSILEAIKELTNLGETIKNLHDKGYYHRDIKPANILFVDDRLYLADFGLVKFPNNKDITEEKADVGPKFTMAPEMRRNASIASGEFADVYSFAKTLWITITGNHKCFDGQYNVLSTVGLSNYYGGLYSKSFDVLLTECTEDSPNQRPKMVDVVRRLKEWTEINNDFHSRNLTEWFDLQRSIFPAGAPKSVTWVDKNDILIILNQIAQVENLNHMFLPDGGGNTFIGASMANEEGFIAIQTSPKSYYILKPKKLTYESSGMDSQWNYFRLEVEISPRTDVYENLHCNYSYEEVVEVEPTLYVDRIHWDENDYNGEYLPESANRICRYVSGSFVIFSTRSIYNRVSDTYDGRHNKMSEDEFRNYITKGALSHAEYLATT
ncbi:protein kinase domain-containing protein [Psychrobacter glacincola]|uniref:protein kinase domain-containing protein n=2 Tax=Moraxellaceae TaxID=468 RepID=UPI003562B225